MRKKGLMKTIQHGIVKLYQAKFQDDFLFSSCPMAMAQFYQTVSVC